MEVPLSQPSKRPGARDISELKARLGLKKSGAAPAPTGGTVPPPPGAKTIPAPPGAAATQSHPDASRDPFGAMNAMTQRSAATAAPPIVIVDDGRPVESVSHENRAAHYGKIAAVLLLPLIVGVLIGKIAQSADTYNSVIGDAAEIGADIGSIGKQLVNIQQALQVAKERGPGGQTFLIGDSKLTEELEPVANVTTDEALVYESNLYSLPPEVVAEVLGFYSDVNKLNADIKNHIAASKDEAKIIRAGMAKLEEFNPFAYAGLLTVGGEEGGAPASIKMVQLGLPICQGENKPTQSGCQGVPSGFLYRLDETGPWGTKKVAQPEGAGVASDSLLLIDPNTKVLQQMVKGGQASVAEAAYERRITSIDEQVNSLLERRTIIEQAMNTKANEGKKFSFFM